MEHLTTFTKADIERLYVENLLHMKGRLKVSAKEIFTSSYTIQRQDHFLMVHTDCEMVLPVNTDGSPFPEDYDRIIYIWNEVGATVSVNGTYLITGIIQITKELGVKFYSFSGNYALGEFIFRNGYIRKRDDTHEIRIGSNLVDDGASSNGIVISDTAESGVSSKLLTSRNGVMFGLSNILSNSSDSTVIGASNTISDSVGSTVVGRENATNAENSIAIGNKVMSEGGVCIGSNNTVTKNNYTAGILIDTGISSTISGGAVALGFGGNSISGSNVIAVGNSLTMTNSSNSILIGGSVSVDQSVNSVIAGAGVSSNATNSTILGISGVDSISDSIAQKSSGSLPSTVSNSISLGGNTDSMLINDISIGISSTLNGQNSVLIGNSSKLEASNSLLLGDSIDLNVGGINLQTGVKGLTHSGVYIGSGTEGYSINISEANTNHYLTIPFSTLNSFDLDINIKDSTADTFGVSTFKGIFELDGSGVLKNNSLIQLHTTGNLNGSIACSISSYPNSATSKSTIIIEVVYTDGGNGNTISVFGKLNIVSSTL